MRHGRHKSRLNRTTEHRTALMRNLACALIEEGVIRTTEPKAKNLRQFIDRVITIAKDAAKAEPDAATSKRRLVFSYLNNKEAVKKLFAEVAPAAANREGGYTRIIKTAPRQGDGAPMAYIEFVDREIEIPEVDTKKKPARKTRAKKADAATAEGTEDKKKPARKPRAKKEAASAE